MIYAHAPREAILTLLPKGGHVVEVGVAEGKFSRPLFDILQPRRLSLVDPWTHAKSGLYTADMNNVEQAVQDKRHDAVATAFAREIADGRVTVLRQTSDDALAGMADGSVDMIYIDGLHTFEGVTADLEQAKRVVGRNGLICGHDFAHNPGAQRMGFQVIEAVFGFLRRNPAWELILLNNEAFPTYIIAHRTPDRSKPVYRDQLSRGMVFSSIVFTEVSETAAMGFRQRWATLPDGGMRIWASF